MKKVIIFDLDGVLVDSAKLVSDYFLSIYPTVTKRIMDEALCGNFHEELDKIKLVHVPIQETPEERKARSEAYTAQKMKTPLFDGIREMLERLKADGHVLVVNTSAFERNSVPLLEYSGVAKLFDFMATAEVSKSKVEKFKITAERYGVSNEDMLFVTDTLGDVREADISHVPTIGVTWGAHDRSFFNREPHENLIAIVDSVGELLKVIQERCL